MTKPKARYRALRNLKYPTDPGVIRRLAAGENLPFKERGKLKRVETGQIVTDLPAVSIPVLLAKGWIEAVAAQDGEGVSDRG